MKQRLADYVADFLAAHGVTDVFSVVGGGAMHLNDALGHHPALHVTYNHHEQASAIAAEAYARIDNKIAALCVTTGPGGTNALTGVVGGWLDSIPMFVISGQVRYDTTARYAAQFTDGLPLRAVGDQEYDITKSVAPMTKYATMLEDPNQIRYVLEKAWHLATTGRPGPVWIDIPVNYQGGYIETDSLPGYDPAQDDARLPPPVDDATVQMVLEKIRNAKRPVFHAGYGIRLSGGYAAFRAVAEKLNIPIVTYWNAVDLIEDENPLYCGRAGNMGDRPGNWAIQNADLILAVGTRISIRQVGYNWKTWARAAEVIMVDIDRAEMKKHTLHVEHPVWADAKDFLQKLDAAAAPLTPVSQAADWLATLPEMEKRLPRRAAAPVGRKRHHRQCVRLCALPQFPPAGKQPDRSFQRRLLRGGQSGVCHPKRQPHGQQQRHCQHGLRPARRHWHLHCRRPPYHHLPGRRWLYHDEPAGIADHPDK